METIQIIFQVLSAFILIVAIFQKEKWKMMLVYTIFNILSVIMFFSFGRTASACISIVASVRTFIYMFYSYKQIKPNLIWLIVFESAFIATTILTWQDALDLMPLFALLASGYGSWQDNQIVLRISYIINGALYVIYKTIIGAYISMSVEAIDLICTIISFVYYCVLKKQTPILQAMFKRKVSQESNNEENENKVAEQKNTDA